MTLLDGPGAGVRLADPLTLVVVVLAVVALLVALRRDLVHGSGGLLFPSLRLLPGGRTSLRVRLRWTLIVLRGAALVLLALALARPQVALAAIGAEAEGIDIALVLDTSSSMTAKDFGGITRMEGAKRAMRTFVAGLKNDRVGVVIFSGEALTLSPLTFDYAATDRLIEPLEPGKLLKDGTAIGVGIATGVNVLRESASKSKVMILFTDGENNLGDITPLDAIELAKLTGIRVYTVGAVGGASVEVNEAQMRDLSSRTGATYFRASNEAAMLSIYQDIAKLEKSRVARRPSSGFEDVYLPLVGGAVALLALELLLAMTFFRKSP